MKNLGGSSHEGQFRLIVAVCPPSVKARNTFLHIQQLILSVFFFLVCFFSKPIKSALEVTLFRPVFRKQLGPKFYSLNLFASDILVYGGQLNQRDCMGPEGVCSRIYEVAMLWSKMLPAAILYLTIAPSHQPLLSVKRPQGLWQIVYVFFLQICVFKCTPASVKRGLHVIPAAVRDPTCSFSQHKNLTNTSKWVCPMEPEGMKKPESIQ